jgi:hypothetical protein
MIDIGRFWRQKNRLLRHFQKTFFFQKWGKIFFTFSKNGKKISPAERPRPCHWRRGQKRTLCELSDAEIGNETLTRI